MKIVIATILLICALVLIAVYRDKERRFRRVEADLLATMLRHDECYPKEEDIVPISGIRVINVSSPWGDDDFVCFENPLLHEESKSK